jgi:hypothetical protein
MMLGLNSIVKSPTCLPVIRGAFYSIALDEWNDLGSELTRTGGPELDRTPDDSFLSKIIDGFNVDTTWTRELQQLPH